MSVFIFSSGAPEIGDIKCEGRLTAKGKGLAFVDTVVTVEEVLEIIVGILNASNLVNIIDEVTNRGDRLVLNTEEAGALLDIPTRARGGRMGIWDPLEGPTSDAGTWLRCCLPVKAPLNVVSRFFRRA